MIVQKHTVWVPAMAALALGLWKTGTPSLWTDELVTIDVARRSLQQIWKLLGHVDAVHGLYYVLMHVVVETAGFTPAIVRLPSVLATAAAAAGVAVLGRQLAGARTGLLAGLIYACTPVVSQYALEARSYASVTALAVLATWALVYALRRGSARWFALYAAALILLGALHLFAILLVGAHLLTLLLGGHPAAVRRYWLVSVVAAGCALAPLAVVAAGQTGAVEWIAFPDGAHLWRSVVGITGSVAATVLVAVVCVHSFVRERAGELLRVALPWLAVPPAALLALSYVEPVFVARYVLICLPALALLVAAGLSAGPRLVTVPAGLALLALTLAVQPTLRAPDNKWHDLTPIVAALRAEAVAGDGYLVTPGGTRALASAYPQVFGPMADLALLTPGARRGTLHGREVGQEELLRRVGGAARVWVVRRLNGDSAADRRARSHVALVRRAGLTVVAGRWSAKNMRLSLHVKPAVHGRALP